ncbi:hypothetical protein Nepgr_020074 [Nepenthes gracilis]|uniref:Uncharacterized protein n=1 Tax=Nepenthes gracilis TaxID=150966 RepID=A0AAD3SVB6_NEPGR|nr:hypothetical protein Nepgr_020074 [Nepenthes gracilis]
MRPIRGFDDWIKIQSRDRAKIEKEKFVFARVGVELDGYWPYQREGSNQHQRYPPRVDDGVPFSSFSPSAPSIRSPCFTPFKTVLSITFQSPEGVRHLLC